MGLRINTNVQALIAQRHLSNNSTGLEKSLERLSSGSRINRAGDDAAGLAISERLRGNIRSLGQANRNAMDGISLIQVAEGAFTEISNILTRLRELSIQGASDTIGDVERRFIDKEVQQLKDEVSRISNVTEFNGRKLLNGSLDKLEIQVGINNNPLEDRLIFNSDEYVVSLDGLGIEDVSTSEKRSAQNNLEKIDSAISKLNEGRSSLGALQNRLQSTVTNQKIYMENLQTANSRIRDTDVAQETSELAKYNILTQSTVAMLAQANQNPGLALNLLG